MKNGWNNGWKLAAVLAAGIGLGTFWNAPGGSLGAAGRAQTGQVAGTSLHVVTFDGSPGRQLIVVDAARGRLACYQVDPEQGTVTLRSVRDITCDLQLKAFNETKPSADEIRAMLGRPAPR